MAEDALLRAIASAYSQAEARDFQQTTLSAADLERLIGAGLNILDNVPHRPFACVPLTALWVVVARDRLRLPAYQVAGDLYVGQHPAFASKSNMPMTASQFNHSLPAWDGHSWVALGNVIADISLLLTTARLPDHSRLKSTLDRTLHPRPRLLAGTASQMADLGLDYRPKCVLTDAQVTACAHGARALFD